MGTTLQYAVDLLATLQNNNKSDAVNNSDYWEFVEKRLLQSTQTGPDQFQDSMDRLQEQYDKESMRMKILKHEETFKYQVRELHRIYKVQKMLMAELKNNKPSPKAIQVGPHVDTNNRIGSWSTTTGSETNCSPFSKLSHPSNQTNSGYNFHQLLSLRVDPNSQEHSTSCSSDPFRMTKGFDLERPAEEDIYNEVSPMEEQARPSSLGSSKNKMSINSYGDPQLYTDIESEVELTLSIGFGSSKKKPKEPCSRLEVGGSGSKNNETIQMDSSISIRSDRGEECSDPTNRTGPANSTFNQESLQKPPWLLQTLSLNRT